jgi:3-oxoacyl-[acyl-carrier-protein] synthase-3
MAKSVFTGVRISGVAGAVPKSIVNNLTDHDFCPEDDRKKIVALTKVGSYRKAPLDMCASDLCVAGAEKLLSELGCNPEEIDAILFATITPDYRLPSTACVVQHRLKCRNTTLAYDINMGCSGFVVGLYNACALIQGGGLKRVLLLAGDTQTKLCYSKDKNVVFILGDAGTATLLEADAGAGDIVIEVLTDGSRFQNLYVPAGGFRRPSTKETREVREQPDGGTRSEDHLYMNGMEIFKFSVTDVVKTLGNFMGEEKLSSDDVDYLFLHQANWFMNDKIAKKLRFPPEKVPYTIESYGNTGSASIPLTIAHHFSQRRPNGKERCLLSGFGVGLSWGVASVMLDRVYCPPIMELA